MAEVTTKKRKRTGKQREEAKKAAIAKAAAEAASVAEPAESAEPEAEVAVATEPENDEPKETAEVDTAIAATEEAKPAVDFEKLKKRTPTALKKLHQLFKQAKREESQRLIKKIKFLSKKDSSSEVDELDTQLKLLGAVDLHILSSNHLKLKLRKHFLIKKDGMPADVEASIGGGQTVKASGSSATPDIIAKVENRLCSAKNVADGVKNIVSWCLGEAGSSLNFEKMKEKKNKQNAKPESDDDSDDASEGDDEREDDVPNALGELDSDDEVVLEEKAADAAGWESGDLGGEGSDDVDEESGAEESGAEGEDGWESGSVGGEEGAGEDAWIASASDSDAPDYSALANLKSGAGDDWSSGSEGGSDAGSASDSSSGSSVAVERPPTKKAKAEAPKKAEKPGKAEKKPEKKAAKAEKPKPDGTSMFLPSLAAGFTAGDSDSDPDMDYDPDGVIGNKAAPRKNRRGQRARQAIWEKKYGKNAKHIVKQREEEKKKTAKKENRAGGSNFVPPTRDSGYKTYRPAPDSAPVLAKPGGTFGSSAPARTPGAAPAGGAPGAGAGADEKKGKNHPSWEAARRRKEAEQKLKDAPKATKIVFD